MKPSNGRFIDIQGQRFGMLLVLEYAESVKNLAYWFCACDCGNRLAIRGNSLRTGNTQSCGCARKLAGITATKEANTTHGMYASPTYRTWQSMLARCQKPSHKSYKYYGGRGISICDEWKTFEKFFADMGVRPVGKTLDRIDNDGHYVQGNCKWSTPKEQSNNRRISRKGEVAGIGPTGQRMDGCAVWAVA